MSYSAARRFTAFSGASRIDATASDRALMFLEDRFIDAVIGPVAGFPLHQVLEGTEVIPRPL